MILNLIFIQQALTVAWYVFIHLLLGYLLFAYFVYNKHNQHFGGKRLAREHEDCPTSTMLEPPEVKKWKRNQERVLAMSELHEENFGSCELLEHVKEVNHDRLVHSKFRHIDTDKKAKAEVLDMDHVYLNFPQFLWAFTFIGPFSYLLWVRNVYMLRLRVFLQKKGIVKMKPIDYEKVVATLCLEQSQAIHYFAKTGKDSKLGNIAGFFFADFPHVNNKGEIEIANLFAVDICLDTHKMVKCKLDDEHLSAKEALILLWYNTIAAQHVKLHAMGNWGVNMDDNVKVLNPFLHQSSLVSVIYNYFGFSCFNGYMNLWKKQGLLSPQWDPQSLQKSFIHGVKENIWQHAHIMELAPHSDFIKFVIRIRSVFHTEFKKNKKVFPGVDAEGLFTGTILHSLDHALMEWNLDDPLWLDVDDPRYGLMAEIGRIVRVGFVPEVPGFYFNRKWYNTGHPFYEAVYQHAVTVNKKFANAMDTCICR